MPLAGIRLFAALSVLLSLPVPSRADDQDTIGNFTQSIVEVYISSEQCKGTLSPGPQEYIQKITVYLTALYPNGFGYWVIPADKKPVANRKICISMMQGSLLAYQVTSRDYSDNYPDQLQPPVLLAYLWPDKASGPYIAPAITTAPAVKPTAPTSRIQ